MIQQLLNLTDFKQHFIIINFVSFDNQQLHLRRIYITIFFLTNHREAHDGQRYILPCLWKERPL